jgi:isochorismate synthase
MSQSISFALYRKPGESPSYVIQSIGEPIFLNDLEELGNQSGYVFAPFQIDKETPCLLITPDKQGLYNSSTISYLRDQLSLYSLTSPQKLNIADSAIRYREAFNLYKEQLGVMNFHKLVLSRSIIQEKCNDFDLFETFERACISYPTAYVYVCYTKKAELWLGCSPEVLLQGTANEWHTVALAGTQQWKGDNTPIVWDKKNKLEQQLVVDYIKHKLDAMNIQNTHDDAHNSIAGSIVHLKSNFRCFPSKVDKIGQVIKSLHPTPATCGLPKDEALEFILNNEGFNRGYYAGFCGMIDQEKNVDLHVNLRCMQIYDKYLELYAGGGILSESTLDTEWSETEYKLQTLLAIL